MKAKFDNEWQWNAKGDDSALGMNDDHSAMLPSPGSVQTVDSTDIQVLIARQVNALQLR